MEMAGSCLQSLPLVHCHTMGCILSPSFVVHLFVVIVVLMWWPGVSVGYVVRDCGPAPSFLLSFSTEEKVVNNNKNTCNASRALFPSLPSHCLPLLPSRSLLMSVPVLWGGQLLSLLLVPSVVIVHVIDLKYR